MQERAANPEHSLVTILAVDTVGSTDHIAGLDPDDAEIFLDKVMAFVSARIEAAGGVLASFHGDGGLAIFGWPNSLEDHADCACEAAWAIQHPEIPFRVSNSPVEFRLGMAQFPKCMHELLIAAARQARGDALPTMPMRWNHRR